VHSGLVTKEQLDFFCTQPNKYKQIAFCESCICKMVSTNDYNLWRFPEYQKYADKEIETFDIDSGIFLLSDPQQKKNMMPNKKR